MNWMLGLAKKWRIFQNPQYLFSYNRHLSWNKGSLLRRIIPPNGNTLYPVWEHFIPKVGILYSILLKA